MTIRFFELPIPGQDRIEIERRKDHRGFFARTFCADEFWGRRLVSEFVQRSISFNVRTETLRGLHYQASPHAETTLIFRTAGAVFDVVVDLRRSVPTFDRWHAETLTADNHNMLYIPVGCVHDFQTLEEGPVLLYEIAPVYVPDAGRGLAHDDPDLAIEWPLPCPSLSDADLNRPRLVDAETFA